MLTINLDKTKNKFRQTTEDMSTKKDLKQKIDYMTDEQCEFISELINFFSNDFAGKGDLLKIAVDETRNMDTAIPLDYQRRIEQVLPSFKSMFNVYDYRTNYFGSMLNVAEEVILKGKEVFNE